MKTPSKIFTWSFHLKSTFSDFFKSFDFFGEVDFFHIKKSKFSKSKNCFCKLFILNPYVSNLQLPTPNISPFGAVNVPKPLDFDES